MFQVGIVLDSGLFDEYRSERMQDLGKLLQSFTVTF
jgi:hypothetical protein